MDVFLQAWACLMDIQRGILSYNQYVAIYCQGPWPKYLLDFLILNPVVIILFMGYSVGLITSRSQEFIKLYWLAYFVVMYALLTVLQNNKVIRYAMCLETTMALFAGLLCYELYRGRKDQLEKAAVLCVAIYLVNLFTFIDVFYLKGLLDPISWHLLRLKGYLNFI
jgi:hypothetical protein